MKFIEMTPTLHQYLERHNPEAHPVLADLARDTAQRSDSRMQISPAQGAFMKLITKINAPQRAVEVGCFTGYSAIATASAFGPEAKLYTLDIDPETSKIAQKYFNLADLHQKIELMIGPATESLNKLLKEWGPGSFDQGFIDADKTNYLTYYELILKLLRPGGLIMVDNTLWSGKVANPEFQDDDTAALRKFNEFVLQDNRVDKAMLALADGIYVLRKK